MEYVIYIICLSILIILTIGTSLGITFEKKFFNNGVCPHCNKKLKRFDTDSQGGRGYSCDCGYTTWISYKCVDKDFYKEQ